MPPVSTGARRVQAPGAHARAARARTAWCFADGVIDQRRSRWIGVCEDHTDDGEPVNSIVAVDLGDGSGPGTRGRERTRFRRVPTALAGWTVASLAGLGIIPNMPCKMQGSSPRRGRAKWRDQSEPRAIACGVKIVHLPQQLYGCQTAHRSCCSDRSGWWNLDSLHLANERRGSSAPMAAEFGSPQWLSACSRMLSLGPSGSSALISRGRHS